MAPVIYGVLGLELAAVIGFAATYNALDFRIYMWGGHAVTQDTRLYLALAYGHWFTYSPFAALAFVPIAAVPLALARVLWDLASSAAGTTGLLVSPISWAHHWVWILPALVLLVRSGHLVAAGLEYLLFALGLFWYTPHSGGPREYGFHGLLTLVANCYLIAGLVFLAYLAARAHLGSPRPARSARMTSPAWPT